MRLNRLDLNLLVALDALLSERSITRAAERMHLSQPATSGALARLRDFFDDELLVRVGAQMMPTPLGESLQAPVHNILLQIQATVERRLEFNEAESNRNFRLLMSDYTSTTFMAGIVEQLANVAPGVCLEFYAPTNNPWEKLEQGEVDFLIMPEHVLSSSHPTQHLFDEGFACIAWDKNSAINDSISVKQFLDLGHVSVRFGSQRTLSQDQVILKEQHGLEPNVEIVASTFGAIPQYLVGTQRIATVYRHLAETWTKYLPLKMVPTPVDMPTIPWGVQWHKFRDLDPGIQWLRTKIINHAEQFNGA